MQKQYVAPSRVFWNSNSVKCTFTSPRQEDSGFKLLSACDVAPCTFLKKKSDNGSSSRQAVDPSGLIRSPQTRRRLYFRLSHGVSILTLAFPGQEVRDKYHVSPLGLFMLFLPQNCSVGWLGEASFHASLSRPTCPGNASSPGSGWCPESSTDPTGLNWGSVYYKAFVSGWRHYRLCAR